MRWIWGAALLALLLVGALALRPAHAARTLACPPGARHIIAGVGPPHTPLLLLFDGDAIGGGVSGADGAYRLPLVVGPERPGAYPVDVVRRDNRAVVDSLTCIVPSPNAPSPAAAPKGQPTNTALPSITTVPTTVATPNTSNSPTATRTPTLQPSATATLRPGAPSPTVTPTGTATATTTGGTAASPTPTATTQAGNLDFTLDDLDSSYDVSDELDVTGSLLNSSGDGISNITITARYTINGTDAIPACSTTTDRDGDWLCPTVTIPSAWGGKTVRVIVTATVSGRSYTATGDSQFTVTNP